MRAAWRTGILAIAVLLATAQSVMAEGAISGVVRDGKEPGAFANVAVLGTHRGAQTAEDGRFLIHVPAGRYAVKASLPGRTLVDSVTVRDGKTTTLDLTFEPPAKPQPPANWHRPSPPSKILLERMDHADTVRVLRVSPRSGNVTRLADYDVSSRRVVTRKDAHAFVRMLSKRESFDAGFEWGEVKLCIPRPGVVVQFEDDAGMVNVFLCYECAMVWVFVAFEGTVGGDFDRVKPEFEHWLARVTPTVSAPEGR